MTAEEEIAKVKSLAYLKHGVQKPSFKSVLLVGLGKARLKLYATIQKYLEVTVKYQSLTFTLLPRINPLINPHVKILIFICYPHIFSIEVIIFRHKQ